MEKKFVKNNFEKKYRNKIDLKKMVDVSIFDKIFKIKKIKDIFEVCFLKKIKIKKILYLNSKKKIKQTFRNLNIKNLFPFVFPIEFVDRISKTKKVMWIDSKHRNKCFNFLNLFTVYSKKNLKNFHGSFIFSFVHFFKWFLKKNLRNFFSNLKIKYASILDSFLIFFFKRNFEFQKKKNYFIFSFSVFMDFFFFKKFFKKKKFFDKYFVSKLIFFVSKNKIFYIGYKKSDNKDFIIMKKKFYSMISIKQKFLKRAITSGIYFFFYKNSNKQRHFSNKKGEIFLKRKLYLFLELDNIFIHNHLKFFKHKFNCQLDFNIVFFLIFKNNLKLLFESTDIFQIFSVYFQKNWLFFLQNNYLQKNYSIAQNLVKITTKKKNLNSILDSLTKVSDKINVYSLIILGNFLKKFSQLSFPFGMFELYALYLINMKLNLGSIIIMNKIFFNIICIYFFVKKIFFF